MTGDWQKRAGDVDNFWGTELDSGVLVEFHQEALGLPTECGLGRCSAPTQPSRYHSLGTRTSTRAPSKVYRAEAIGMSLARGRGRPSR